MIENVILVLSAAILLIFTVRGYKRGLFGFIFGAISWIFVFIFLNIASPYIEEWLLDSEVYTSVHERVEAGVREKVDDIISSDEEKSGSAIEGLIAMFGTGIGINTDSFESIDRINELMSAFNGQVGDQIVGQINEEIAGQMDALTTTLSDEITARLMHVFAILISIVVGAIICQFLKMIFTILHDLPITGTMSRIIGAVWGFIEGLLIVWVIMLVITLIGINVEDFENPILIYLFERNAILAIAERMR